MPALDESRRFVQLAGAAAFRLLRDARENPFRHRRIVQRTEKVLQFREPPQEGRRLFRRK
jgi:hypothetical protein